MLPYLPEGFFLQNMQIKYFALVSFAFAVFLGVYHFNTSLLNRSKGEQGGKLAKCISTIISIVLILYVIVSVYVLFWGVIEVFPGFLSTYVNFKWIYYSIFSFSVVISIAVFYFSINFLKERKKTVLIVDDDEFHLTMTKSILSEDYEVVAAKSGQAALNLFVHGLVPHLVLLDLTMPDMDGWETYERIKEISNLYYVPIAFFTSSDDPDDINRAREMGVADFIKKPVKRNEFLERVEALTKS
jgi:CheY-like chemotaxis protein